MERGPLRTAGGDAREVFSLTVSGGAIFAGIYAGIYRSVDNGATWSTANTGLPERVTASCLMTSGETIIAGTPGYGIYRSSDNGATWSEANTGLPNIFAARFVNSLTASGGAIIAGTYAGIYRSVDNGATWNEANSGLPAGDAREVFSLTVSGGAVIAGTDAGI